MLCQLLFPGNHLDWSVLNSLKFALPTPLLKASCIFYDFIFRLTVACQKKCISPKYKEGDLTKGESVCLDRCVAKYLEIHDRIGKKLTAMSMQDEKLMNQLQGQG